jgi:hypothetical protein
VKPLKVVEGEFLFMRGRQNLEDSLQPHQENIVRGLLALYLFLHFLDPPLPPALLHPPPGTTTTLRKFLSSFTVSFIHFSVAFHYLCSGPFIAFLSRITFQFVLFFTNSSIFLFISKNSFSSLTYFPGFPLLP